MWYKLVCGKDILLYSTFVSALLGVIFTAIFFGLESTAILFYFDTILFIGGVFLLIKHTDSGDEGFDSLVLCVAVGMIAWGFGHISLFLPWQNPGGTFYFWSLITYIATFLLFMGYGRLDYPPPPSAPRKKPTQRKTKFVCQYCFKPFRASQGRIDHERQCKKNPNHIPLVKKKKKKKKARIDYKTDKKTVVHHRTTFKEKETIITERVLLVCPNCNRRTEQGNRKCHHCGAPL